MKAINLERENFGFLNVFYVKDNPVMGYDNFGFWGISFGPWAYVPPKPKIPDWCKCEKSRRKHREECERKCHEEHPRDWGIVCYVVYTSAWEIVGIFTNYSKVLASSGAFWGSLGGIIVGGTAVIGSYLICAPATVWCLFKCWLEERTLCEEPDRWWETGRYPSYPYRFQ